MTTAIAVFVKTPALSPVKTRLAKSIGKAKALEFYFLSLKAIKEILQSTGVSVYWAVAEESGLSDPMWQDFKALWTGEGGLGERQHRIYETLLQKHDRVLLIGADAPQISTDILEQAIVALDTNNLVIGPARDGGYYLFGGRIPTERKIWTSVPWSTSLTRERLEAVLPSKPFHLQMLTDVDTENDLEFTTKEMPQKLKKGQKNIIEWIKEAHDHKKKQ
jgi:hypothetical protein